MLCETEMSSSIKELSAALCKAQASMKPAVKDTTNPFFKSKYADLSAVWDAIRAPLTTNGLSIVQSPADSDGETVVLDTLLLHASGEWIRSRLRMKPVKHDPQGIGSCITYARRYALGAITGVATEEDDDGNNASHKRVMQQVKVIEPAAHVAQAEALPPPTLAPKTYPGVEHFMTDMSTSLPADGPVTVPVAVASDPPETPPVSGIPEPHMIGVVSEITKASKPTKANRPWGTIKFLTLPENEEVLCNWFGFSGTWDFESVNDCLVLTDRLVHFTIKPSNNPKYKPTLEHFEPEPLA